MSELKPCPFCGKYPQKIVDDETEEKFGVKCFNCGGSIYPEKATLQEAIEAWNGRVEAMSDTISRQAAIKAYGDWYVEEGTAEGFIGTVKQLLEGLPSAQPDRSLRFRIGEICVDESKGFISSDRAVEKIRALLRVTERWKE